MKKATDVSLTPVRQHRRSKPHPIYYKTECLECEVILSTKWEQAYVGPMPMPQPRSLVQTCPFCSSEQIKTVKIVEKEYLMINQQWDTVDALAEKEMENASDWRSWIRCGL